MDIQKAFFSDGTREYRPTSAKAGESIRIRLRTPKNMAVPPLLLSDFGEKEMEPVEEGLFFDYYDCSVTLPDEPFKYAFKVIWEERIWYYTKNGLKDYYEWQDSLEILPGFSVPGWAEGAVMYQIFPDRFCNGEKGNDVVNGEYYYAGRMSERVWDWNDPPKTFDVNRFYGGDLPGVQKKLDYLKDLGVEVIYLNPVFVSPSNHKYDCQDYEHIDPHLTHIVKDAGSEGTFGHNRYVIRTTDPDNLKASDDFFVQFVQDVHAHGMKLILDGVFNHCGSFNKWMDREGYYSGTGGNGEGAYGNRDSRYRDFFTFSDPNDPDSYEGWWGFDTLPKLNYEGSEDLCEYICEIGRKWVSPPFSCDGWRLDVAGDLGHSPEFNHMFWKRFRKAVKEANPEAIILAEHYGDAWSWLRGDEWDTVMNYDAFMDPLSAFLTGMDKHSDSYNAMLFNNAEELAKGLYLGIRRFPPESMFSAMNELSNHDHSRFLTRTNKYVGRVAALGTEAASRDIHPEVFAEAVVFQMTWPGCPTIYYGDEAGLCGFTDPDNRRTYPWGNENRALIELHKTLAGFRKALPVLRRGSTAPLVVEEGIFAFARFDRNNVVVVILNNNDHEADLSIPLTMIDIDVNTMVSLMETRDGVFGLEAHFYNTENRTFKIKVGARSAVILKNHGF